MTPRQYASPVEREPAGAIDWAVGTVSDGLDRLEALVGRIGMNSPEQARAILDGFDMLSARIEAFDNPSSQKPLQVQMQAILARMQNEAAVFLRDLGGLTVLQSLRADYKPPAENSWWYLDDWLALRRKQSTRKMLRMLAAFIVGFALLAVVYQVFLAPDPAVVARLDHTESGRDALMNGDLAGALSQIEQGLQYDPQDLDLLILKGVALAQSGKPDQAEPVFEQAAAAAENREEFLLVRGQAYLIAGNLDAAMADVDSTLAENSQSAAAYLLAGQIYESKQDFQRAYDTYEQASAMANAQDRPELAAIARARLAYLIQIMNSPQYSPTVPPP